MNPAVPDPACRAHIIISYTLLATPYINVGIVVVADAPPLLFAECTGLPSRSSLAMVLGSVWSSFWDKFVDMKFASTKKKTSSLHRLCILLVPILFQIRPRFLCVLMLPNCPKSFIVTGCHLLIQEGENPWVEAPAFSLDGGGNFLGLWGWRSVLYSSCISPFNRWCGNLMDFLLVPSGLQILSNWSLLHQCLLVGCDSPFSRSACPSLRRSYTSQTAV